MNMRRSEFECSWQTASRALFLEVLKGPSDRRHTNAHKRRQKSSLHACSFSSVITFESNTVVAARAKLIGAQKPQASNSTIRATPSDDLLTYTLIFEVLIVVLVGGKVIFRKARPLPV